VAVRRPVPVSPPAGAPGRVRLTRRGRVTLLVMVVIALLVALSAGRVMSSAATPGSAGQPTHTYVVEPGDTAWSIARTAMPGVDGRLAVDRLLAMNHSDGQLRVGQALVVPGA
jgi:LysM repeat protein